MPQRFRSKDVIIRASRICSAGAVALAISLYGCQPKVKIEPPDEPIVINLNVKIEQEIRVKVERDLEQLLAENPDIF